MGALCTWMGSRTRESTSKPFSSALLSALLSMCSSNLALIFGPPTLCPVTLLGPGAPTSSTLVMMEQHTLLLYSDILLILGVFSNMHTLDGLGNFKCALKVNREIWTSWFAWFFWVFWVKSKPFSEVTSSCFLEEPYLFLDSQHFVQYLAHRRKCNKCFKTSQWKSKILHLIMALTTNLEDQWGCHNRA